MGLIQQSKMTVVIMRIFIVYTEKGLILKEKIILDWSHICRYPPLPLTKLANFHVRYFVSANNHIH